MIHAIDMTDEAAEDALVLLAEHLGPAIPIGRPQVALPGADGSVLIISTERLWWSYPDHADGLDTLPTGEYELVEYANGIEQSRTVTVID